MASFTAVDPQAPLSSRHLKSRPSGVLIAVLMGRLAAERVMGPLFVVIDHPPMGGFADIVEAGEKVLVEHFFPECAVQIKVPDSEVSPHFFLQDQALGVPGCGRKCAHGARFKVTKPEKSTDHARQRSITEVLA